MVAKPPLPRLTGRPLGRPFAYPDIFIVPSQLSAHPRGRPSCCGLSDPRKGLNSQRIPEPSSAEKRIGLENGDLFLVCSHSKRGHAPARVPSRSIAQGLARMLSGGAVPSVARSPSARRGHSALPRPVCLIWSIVLGATAAGCRRRPSTSAPRRTAVFKEGRGRTGRSSWCRRHGCSPADRKRTVMRCAARRRWPSP